MVMANNKIFVEQTTAKVDIYNVIVVYAVGKTDKRKFAVFNFFWSGCRGEMWMERV